MKSTITPISLPVAELKPALAGLNKIVSKRAAIPVLTCIRVDRHDDAITLSGTDRDASVSVRLDSNPGAEPLSTLSTLVPFTPLNAIVKACRSGDEIQISPERNHVTISYPVGNQMISQRIESVPVEEWPITPSVSGEAVSLPEPLRTSFLEALQCVSDDSTRPMLRGVYLDVSDPKCHSVVSTDGRHLYASNSFHLAMNDSIIIPDHPFLHWSGFAGDANWKLQSFQNKKDEKEKESWLRLSGDRWSFTSKQVEGHYPNWRQVLPETVQGKRTAAAATFPAETDTILNAIRQLPDPDQRSHGIGIRIEPGSLTLIAASNEGAPAEIHFPAESTSENVLTIQVNRNYLIKALRLGLRKLHVTDEKSALQFTSPENPGKQMIVMPLYNNNQNNKTETPQPTPPRVEPERKTTMSETEIKPNNEAESKPALETAIAQAESVKDVFRNAIASLNELTTTLRQSNREQKANEREIHSVRKTLRSLQSVKI